MVLQPEEPEDLWHTYNLVSKGDIIHATTIRKVAKPSASGSSESERVKMNLSVRLETVDFDPPSGVLRLSGRNQTENEYVKLGAYHTLDVELHRNFTLHKAEWDSVTRERVRDATDPRITADVAAVVMSEGLAHVCLITGSMTLLRQRIDMPIPRKRGAAAAGHDKAVLKFYETILQAILKHVNFGVVKCVIVASPAFYKDQFMEYVYSEAQKRGLKEILDNRKKFMLAHASSGHKHALKELLADPAMVSLLADTKAAEEVQALNGFLEMLNTDSNRAYYGYNHVSLANERGAIQTLLVSDSLFRSDDIATRRKYVALVESVKATGAPVYIFSSLHVSGEQLAQLSGVAAVLRYGIPEIEEEAEEEEEQDQGGTDDRDNNTATANGDARASSSRTDPPG